MPGSKRKLYEHDGVIKDRWARQEVHRLTKIAADARRALGPTYSDCDAEPITGPTSVDTRLDKLEREVLAPPGKYDALYGFLLGERDTLLGRVRDLEKTVDALLEHLQLQPIDKPKKRVMKKVK